MAQEKKDYRSHQKLEDHTKWRSMAASQHSTQ